MKNLSKLFAMALALLVVAGPAAAELAKGSFAGGRAQWDVQADFERAVLTVSTPGGTVLREEFGAGQTPVFDLARLENAADGSYTWELRITPRVDPSTRKALAESRRSGEQGLDRTESEARAAEGRVQSGSFLVQAGSIVEPEGREERAGKGMKSAVDNMGKVTAADQVIPDDLIVQGSGCFGFDCVNNESFGFDTIRLKENNLRIKFEDTSVGTFPSNDWQLTANDSASGGANKFSIEDITGAKVPFTVRAGAANNSIFVDSTGRVGFRTATPVLDLHVSTSNTPALRLEQTNAGGFTAQTWDVAGNEANFFVRDVTGGSKLSFRIRPGAPTSSIDIASDGDVGIGTASPDEKLHVEGNDGDTAIKVEETNATATPRLMLELVNNGGVQSNLVDTSTGATWGANNINGNYRLAKSGSGVVFELDGSGNLSITGNLSQGSDRNSKHNIVEVDPDTVLAKVANLPIAEWTYKTDETQARHLGPMAQDFAATFGLGPDNTHIAPGDMAGVSLAAVQALHKQVSAKDAELEALRRQNDELARRLAELEARISAIAPK